MASQFAYYTRLFKSTQIPPKRKGKHRNLWNIYLRLLETEQTNLQIRNVRNITFVEKVKQNLAEKFATSRNFPFVLQNLTNEWSKLEKIIVTRN